MAVSAAELHPIYVLCQVDWSDGKKRLLNFNQSHVYKTLVSKVSQMYGDYGIGILQESLRVKYLNSETQMIMIRVFRKYHQMLLSCLPLINQITKNNTSIRGLSLQTLHLSGTIRSCQKFIVKHHKLELQKMLKKCKNEDERAQLEKITSKALASLEQNGASKTYVQQD